MSGPVVFEFSNYSDFYATLWSVEKQAEAQEMWLRAHADSDLVTDEARQNIRSVASQLRSILGQFQLKRTAIFPGSQSEAWR